MLVLSRGQNDRIVFPALGISVEVLKVRGSKASLGIEAPKDIKIVRHELLSDDDVVEQASALRGDISDKDASQSARDLRHEFRNQINQATLKLQLAAKLLAQGKTDVGLSTMSAGIAELHAINGSAKSNPATASAGGTEGDAGDRAMTLAEAKATFDVQQPQDGRRVLLVDDDDNERTLMASYLKRCGMDVEEASDGLKALYALSKTQQPDVVLLDMNMPNLDGRATIERIRTCSQHPNVPVFAVTGDSFDDSGISIGEDGLTGWFQKPVQVDEIIDAIDQCARVG